jgi:hypothetical protein
MKDVTSVAYQILVFTFERLPPPGLQVQQHMGMLELEYGETTGTIITPPKWVPKIYLNGDGTVTTVHKLLHVTVIGRVRCSTTRSLAAASLLEKHDRPTRLRPREPVSPPPAKEPKPTNIMTR